MAPRPEAIRAASSRISRCARSISSTARCCSSSASSGDLVVMPRKATAARDGSASDAFIGCRGAPTLAVVVAQPARDEDAAGERSARSNALPACRDVVIAVDDARGPSKRPKARRAFEWPHPRKGHVASLCIIHLVTAVLTSAER